MAQIDDGGVQALTVEASRGVNWWSEAWALFMKNPGMWVVFGLIMLVAFFVLHYIPLGVFLFIAAFPALMGSFMLAARKAEQGGTLEINDIGLAFKEHLNPLLVVGALSVGAALVVSLVIGIALGIMGLGAVISMGFDNVMLAAASAMAAFGAFMVALLAGLVLAVPISMALWFAPALVVFRGVAPVNALKASFAACLRNVVPFLLYGLVFIVAAFVATIPAFLGWLALIPLIVLTTYLAYRDIFGD